MRLASKAALLLSPDLRAVAKDVHEARDLVLEAGLSDPALRASLLREAHERLTRATAALEGR